MPPSSRVRSGHVLAACVVLSIPLLLASRLLTTYAEDPPRPVEIYDEVVRLSDFPDGFKPQRLTKFVQTPPRRRPIYEASRRFDRRRPHTQLEVRIFQGARDDVDQLIRSIRKPHDRVVKKILSTDLGLGERSVLWNERAKGHGRIQDPDNPFGWIAGPPHKPGRLTLFVYAGLWQLRLHAMHATTDETAAEMEQFLPALAEQILGRLSGEAPPEARPEAPPKDSPDPRVDEIVFFDANPLFRGGGKVQKMTFGELMHYARTRRRGAVTDGVSQLIVRAKTSGPGEVRFVAEEGQASGPWTSGSFDLLVHGDAHPTDEDAHYAFALYTPPHAFQTFAPGARLAARPTPSRSGPDRVATRTLRVVVTFTPERPSDDAGEEKRGVGQQDLVLARPPVLLVHGTFDTPRNCWETAAGEDGGPADSRSMVDILRRAGFGVFLTDYAASNKESFSANKRTIWAAPGGIHDALRSYRRPQGLNLAAAQVDVVGHSLGGLLARLWASEKYNPPGAADGSRDATGGYRRADNFKQGDIHRLITIGTPHQGTDLASLGLLLKGLIQPSVRGPGSLRQAMAWRAERIVIGLSALSEVYDLTARAIEDQRAHLPSHPNPDLVALGRTPIPAHAITCRSTLPDIRESLLFRLLARVSAFWLLNVRDEVTREFLAARGQGATAERLFGQAIALDDRLAGSWLGHEPLDPASIPVQDQHVLALLLRAAIFGNTANDLVVRVESQAGGLPRQYVTPLTGTLHSFETRHPPIQETVLDLLVSGLVPFHPDGFPTPAPMMNVEPYVAAQDAASRRAAIMASGIVAGHAEALSWLADERDQFIIMRPVNHHATTLIAGQQATKAMHVKGKSSNWGPQRGYIAVHQRFSKLYFFIPLDQRAAEIADFDRKVQDCLADGKARVRGLEVSMEGTTYVVFEDADEPEPPSAIYLLNRETGEWRHWMGEDQSPELVGPEHIATRTLEPLYVLSDPISNRFLTADYDLLAIAWAEAPLPPTWDDEMGVVNAATKVLIHEINRAVATRGRYEGGNVSHHGPETNYPGSPGVDYPITVFDPNGYIISVEEGPSGSTDMWVKRMFHLIRVQGYHITPNGNTWNWGPYQPATHPESGWRREDASNRGAAGDEDDNPFDSDEGDEPAQLPAIESVR